MIYSIIRIDDQTEIKTLTDMDDMIDSALRNRRINHQTSILALGNVESVNQAMKNTALFYHLVCYSHDQSYQIPTATKAELTENGLLHYATMKVLKHSTTIIRLRA